MDCTDEWNKEGIQCRGSGTFLIGNRDGLRKLQFN